MLADYDALKHAIEAATHAPPAILHMHAGMAIFTASAVLFGRGIRSWWAIALVWFFAGANEILDSLYDGYDAHSSLVDLANTVGWPTMIFAIVLATAKRAERTAAG